MSQPPSKVVCLNGDGVRVIRGLCRTCYQRVLARVRAGELTWPEAERAGLCQPPAPRSNRWAWLNRRRPRC